MEKAIWDAYHIRVFCELAAKEVGAGNRPGPFLSPKGYKNLEESFFQQTKKRYVKKQFKNRWDSLKKEYTQWKELKIAASGLGWDSKLETVVADPDWWSVHLQKHPEHAKYRNAGPANLAEMHKMFDSRHVTGAQSAIPGEKPLEETTEVDDDDTDEEEDDRIKAKRRKRKSKADDDELTVLDEKNPFVRMYKKTTDAIRTTAEEISNSKTPPSLAPTMKEAMVMVRECGVEEGTPLFFSSSMLLMKAEYSEMFASVESLQGRLDWLERAHDHL